MTEGEPGPAPRSTPSEGEPGDPLTLEALVGPVARTVDFGLHRMERVLDELDRPHDAFASVLIGGTNGKGSTAAILASILRASGARVGLYTSPHLRRFSERIRIDGLPAPDPMLRVAGWEVSEPVASAGATWFEAATVLAFECFRQAGVEIAVVEVGLGGRLDATNVLAPLATGITNVQMDHSEWLGTTVEEIAAEKAGIARAGVPMVSTVEHEGARAVIMDVCREVGAPFVHVDPKALHLERAAGTTRLGLSLAGGGLMGVRLPFPGVHQARNAALALHLADLLPDAFRPSPDDAIRGTESARWPGRLQVVRRSALTIVLDVAHNPAGVRAMLDGLEEMGVPSPVHVVLGILADKDWAGMVPPLLDVATSVVLTTPPSAPQDRVWDPVAVMRALGSPAGVEVVDDLLPAVELAVGRAAGGTMLVTGSSYTVGDAMDILGIDAHAGG